MNGLGFGKKGCNIAEREREILTGSDRGWKLQSLINYLSFIIENEQKYKN